MKILKTVIPILLYFSSFVSNWYAAKKCDVNSDVKLFPTEDILLQIFDIIQSDVASQKGKH